MIATEAPHERKARGAFYTPAEIADYLTTWAVTASTRRVLEPSTGDGAFIEALARRAATLRSKVNVVGVELIRSEAAIARERGAALGLDIDIRVGDFFSMGTSDLGVFDAVVGNPPWIRYHGFKGAQRDRGLQRAAEVGVELGGLASSWAPYVAHACALLAGDGRLGLVLPAELLQVDYAIDLRRFLSERFASIRLVAFERHIFGDAQVDAILLLASQDGLPGVTFERVDRLEEIGSRPRPLGSIARWANAVVAGDALGILGEMEANRRLVRLGSLGSVDIGVVTGHNEFFLLSAAVAEAFDVPPARLLPCVSRSAQLVDGVVTADHFAAWQAAGRKAWLLALDRTEPNGASRYLSEGMRIGVQDRYKCRMRRPWYSVPLKAPPDLFLSYMAHEVPRLAWNRAGAVSTNLIHGVYLKNPSDAEGLAAGWQNPATALSTELEGRTYGGGVLKIETKEAERILVPAPGAPLALTPDEREILTRALGERRASRMRRPRAV